MTAILVATLFCDILMGQALRRRTQTNRTLQEENFTIKTHRRDVHLGNQSNTTLLKQTRFCLCPQI